jgi:hypothetical protein
LIGFSDLDLGSASTRCRERAQRDDRDNGQTQHLDPQFIYFFLPIGPTADICTAEQTQ